MESIETKHIPHQPMYKDGESPTTRPNHRHRGNLTANVLKSLMSSIENEYIPHQLTRMWSHRRTIKEYLHTVREQKSYWALTRVLCSQKTARSN